MYCCTDMTLIILHRFLTTLSISNKYCYRSQRTTKPTMKLVQLAVSNKPAHLSSLIRVFADCMYLLQPLGYQKMDNREPIDVQADLRLSWSHRSYCMFCLALAHISYFSMKTYVVELIRNASLSTHNVCFHDKIRKTVTSISLLHVSKVTNGVSYSLMNLYSSCRPQGSRPKTDMVLHH